MALYSRVHVWVSNEILTASDLNAEFNNILTNATAAELIGYSANVSQMQTVVDPGGVGTESLAGSVSDELARIRFKLKQIIGSAQWYSTGARDLTATLVAADIAAGAITTTKVADGAITQAKRAALGQQISSLVAGFSSSSTTLVDVTSLTVTITTTGRPVMLMLISGGTGSQINFSSSTTTIDGFYVTFLRGASVIGEQEVLLECANVGSIKAVAIPTSSFQHVDITGAATITYKIQTKVVTGSATVNFDNVQLLAYEL